jgi:hypothetical protein
MATFCCISPSVRSARYTVPIPPAPRTRTTPVRSAIAFRASLRVPAEQRFDFRADLGRDLLFREHPPPLTGRQIRELVKQTSDLMVHPGFSVGYAFGIIIASS